MKKTRILVFLAAIVLCLAAELKAQTPKDVTIYGQKIHYLEAGSGPNLILLHGLGGSSQVWGFNIGPLAEKYHVFVPDQIGFGKSDKPFVNYRIRTYVDFLDQFCQQLKIERPILVGNSMGGWIAAIYAATYPDRVDKLVLVDAAGYAPPKDFDTRAFFGLNPTTRAEMKVLSAKVFYNKAFLSDTAIDQAMTARLGAGDGYTIKSITESIIRGEDFLDDVVKTIKQPTLVVWGREDGLLPLSDAERFHKDIPGSMVVVIDQCAHVPNIEKPGEFNAAVIKFLSGGAQ
jgi:pimeloyl-ACP methyl ester carboxylesterase